MKLEEFKNEDAIDLVADLIEPMSKIFTDEDLKKAAREKKTRAELVKIALKNNKEAIVEIMARLEGETVEAYQCTPISLLASVLELLKDKELLAFFQTQGQEILGRSSGSVTENTEAGKN